MYEEYFCPNCGATLNNQSGFDSEAGTWTCTSCGFFNVISEDEIIDNNNHTTYSDYNDDEIDDDDFDKNNGYSQNSSYYSHYESTNNSSNSSLYSTTSSKEKSSDSNSIFSLFLLMLIPFGLLFLFQINEWIAIKDGKINAGYYRDLIGEKVETVEAHFEAAGFNNITLIDLDDSRLFFWNDGKVKMISIAGNNTFEKTDWFSPDAEVVITYH